MKSIRTVIALTFLTALFSACSGSRSEQAYPLDNEDTRALDRGKITGEGIKLFSTADDREKAGAGTGIGVNSFLWRASLDTLSFMPLDSVDPHGGVIITDWYENPDARGEKFKVNVLILGTRLRSDGIRVSVFKKYLEDDGQWRDMAVGEDTARQLENKILTRARELRIASAKDK